MRVFGVCLLLSWFVLGPRASFAGDPQWIEVRSPNFSVITDAGEKRGRDVALHFEQMRSAFGALMKANVNLSVPLQIVAFRNTKEMRQVAPIWNGKPTELAGLFQGGTDRSFIMLDMSADNPWTVVFHEYAHRLMDGNLSFRTAPWFEEGFAEYFSSIEVDNKEARVGKIPEQTYQILERMGMLKVADLFLVQHYSKTYNENGDHRTTFYAESSLTVHYLYDNLLIPKKVAVYFNALQVQKKPVEQAVLLAFGMTPEQFDKALRNYLKSGRSTCYPIPTPKGIVAAEFTATPVSLANARAVLADIHAHSPDHKGQALEEFHEVLKLDPDNAAALRGMGYAYLQRRDFEHAGEYFRRAAEHNSKDPRVHYYYAMLMNQEGGRLSDHVAEMKKELETAILLDPKLADAYSMLGFAQSSSGEPEKGLETMKKAVELAPRNEGYQFNLANIYLANRKVDEAIAIFRSLTGSGNPEFAVRASEALAQAEAFKSQPQSFGLRVESRIATKAETPRESRDDVSAPIPAEVPPVLARTRFVKGKLVSVDCSAAPTAVLSVVSGARSLKLHVRDSARVVMIGEDQFSCDWKNKSVAVNYRERPDGEGDVISVEVH
jgi:tetratricopeptide (TPR) repeat protein